MVSGEAVHARRIRMPDPHVGSACTVPVAHPGSSFAWQVTAKDLPAEVAAEVAAEVV